MRRDLRGRKEGPPVPYAGVCSIECKCRGKKDGGPWRPELAPRAQRGNDRSFLTNETGASRVRGKRAPAGGLKLMPKVPQIKEKKVGQG